MTRVIVSRQARRDLSKLTLDITKAAGQRIAEDFVDRLIARIRTLSNLPQASGRLVPHLAAEVRCHPFGNYNLYLRYEQSSDTLQVVRVLHSRRNITAKHFRE